MCIYIYIYLKNEKNRVKEIIEKGGERERDEKGRGSRRGGLSDRVATDDPLKLLHDKS